MSQVLLVLRAVILQQVGVGTKDQVEFDGHTPSEGFGVVKRELELCPTEVDAVKTLGDAQTLGVSVSEAVQNAAIAIPATARQTSRRLASPN